LADLAKADGFVFAAIDSASTKTHMVDQIFFAVARQIDWQQLARTIVSRLVEIHGLHIPAEASDFSCTSIASLNNREELLLRSEIHRWLEKAIYRDYAMTQEFRLAMLRLCMGELDPAATPSLITSVKEWLRGELRLITALRKALIFQRITRKNARHMLFSLSHWLRLCQKKGLVISIDISRYTVSKRAEGQQYPLYYSISAVIDGHEALRQFIDGTDELEGCLVIVVAAPEFLTDFRRGINCYDALRLRIADEVHDKSRVNPLAPLIQIGVSV
jgi:hypothetical protein